VDKTLMAGPGTLSQAMGITTNLSGKSLSGKSVWIEDHDLCTNDKHVHCGPRIGIDYAEEDAARPYRFVIDPATLL